MNPLHATVVLLACRLGPRLDHHRAYCCPRYDAVAVLFKSATTDMSWRDDAKSHSAARLVAFEARRDFCGRWFRRANSSATAAKAFDVAIGAPNYPAAVARGGGGGVLHRGGVPDCVPARAARPGEHLRCDLFAGRPGGF